MNLRGMALMMAAMAMSGDFGYGYNERRYYSRPTYKSPIKPFDFKVKEIPKGHKVETIPVEFIFGKQKFSYPELEFTYANEKGKIKRANARLKEVFEYLKNTPNIDIDTFKQFTITEIES